MKKLRNEVRNKKETLQKLIENYENGILPRINFVQIICCNNITSVLKAHEREKWPNLHTNELNTTFFCSTSPLKAPNRLKSLKLA
jgi:hypothetical protein